MTTATITKNIAQEIWLESILNAAPLGIIVIDSGGKIFMVNREVEKLFGYKPEELEGQYVEVLIPERYREGHPALRNSYTRSDSEARSMGAERELMALHKDGSEFSIEIGLGPVMIEGKKNIVATIIDTTEKREHAAREKRQAEKIQALYNDFLEVSTPLLTLWEGITVLPLIGTLDSRRAQDAMEKSLSRMAEDKVRVLIIDITGVIAVDTMVADQLIRMAAAVRLMGGECILTGISPEIARTVSRLGVDFSELNTRATLADGFALAIRTLRSGKAKQWKIYADE